MSLINGKKIILVVASDGYQPIEYSVTKRMLENQGIKVITASNLPGGAVASDLSTTNVDVALDKITISEYDGIFFIGGPGAMKHLDNPNSYHILSQAKKLEIPYGGICIAPRILAKAYALEGKKATCWNDDNATAPIFDGFHVINEMKHDVVTDGLVVTANGPHVADQFAQGIIRVLTKKALQK